MSARHCDTCQCHTVRPVPKVSAGARVVDRASGIRGTVRSMTYATEWSESIPYVEWDNGLSTYSHHYDLEAPPSSGRSVLRCETCGGDGTVTLLMAPYVGRCGSCGGLGFVNAPPV